MWAKIITIKRTKYLNYFSLCAFNLFNTRVSQFELNYWNKWTFHLHSNLLKCTCICANISKSQKLFFSFKFWTPVCLYGILLRACPPPIQYILHPIHHLIIKLWVLLVVQYSCIGMFGEERTSWTTIDTLYITGTHKQGRVIWPFNFISTGQCKEGQKVGERNMVRKILWVFIVYQS